MDSVKVLKDIIESGKNIEDAVLEQSDWDVFYHLSETRKNILSWFDLKQDANVLEIGAECGALTGLLCEKAKHVTAIDPSKEYCETNALRNRFDNLDIITGKFKDIKFDCAFDYVTMIGASVKEVKDAVSRIAPLINVEGIVIIAGEGDPDAYMKLLNKAGLTSIKTYYPKPDYITTLEISSDAGDSGSFLLFAGKEPVTIDISFIKFACLRKPEFRIFTALAKDGVIKSPMTEAASDHIRKLASNRDRVADVYNRITPVECEIRDGSAVFPLISGETLTIEFMDAVFDYKEPLSDFVVTDSFKAVFGDMEIPAGEKAYPVINVDSNLDNFMLSNGKIYCLDYEWIFDFPVPVRFVKYRLLFYAGIAPEKFAEYGFTDDDVKLFHSMEIAFQQYVSGEDFKYIVTSKFSRPEPQRKKHFWER
ncbi:MAG: hypothetical protein K6F45_06490 [Saccharofermentans sp.]|nr:hypothetical protein [Saccharofermentans sp.]